MTDQQSGTDNRPGRESQTAQPLFQSALDQFSEDCRIYNEAIGSYNTHLDNHRDRRDLHDIPFRTPISAHDAYGDARDGDRAALEAILDHLLEEVHLDSQLRRHPRTYPIHIEATEHLVIARDQLVTTLEETIRHLKTKGTRGL